MAGKIPEKFIDELLTRVDIVDVIDSRVPLKKAGREYKACCPFHDEKTPSFTVSQAKQFYHCFGCGAHGSAIGFLMEYERMSFPEAIDELAHKVGLEVPHEARLVREQPDQSSALLEILAQADRCFRRWLREHPQAPDAVSYLKKRGVSGEVAARFGLGFAPDGWDNLLRAIGTTEAARDAMLAAGLIVKKDGGGFYDRFRNRVMFPILDHRGRLVGFGGRVLDKGEPKYLNSPETPLFHKGRELYGLYQARDALKRDGRALVVEGYMDVVSLAQFEIDFAVATLGTATTRDHLERLFRHVGEVVFCFDGDRAGRDAAWRALENSLAALHEGRQASFLFLPDGEDPDTLVRKQGASEFRNLLKTAIPLPDYFFQHLAQQVDLTRLDGRARFVELARPYLAKLAPGILRQLMTNRLAELSQVGAADIGMPADREPRPGPKTRASSSAPSSGQPSLVRTAVALLLHRPELVRHIEKLPFLAELQDRAGVDLLMEMVAWLEPRPETRTGAILEHFRDSPHQSSLAKLAMRDHPALDGDVDAEFEGVVRALEREAIGAAAERLTQKARLSGKPGLSGLTEAEQAELKRLLAGKAGRRPGLSS